MSQNQITRGGVVPPGLKPPNTQVVSGGTVTVTGTVTANAGTNLNTSALALESGGNLAGLVTRTGEVQATPTSNTILGRLKDIFDRLNISNYIQSDFDDQNTTKYYGFVNSSGYWYIRQEDWVNGTIRFAKGTTSYSTNWTGRAGLSYAIYNGFN